MSPPTTSFNFEPKGAWVGGPMGLADGVETMSLSGKSFAPNLPHLAEGQERKIYYFQLFPNLLISAHPDYVMTHRLQPLSPDNTFVECEWLFSREAVEAEGFDPSYASDFWDITNRPRLGRGRIGAAGRLLARLPAGAPVSQGRCRLRLRHHGRQRLPRGQGGPPRRP